MRGVSVCECCKRGVFEEGDLETSGTATTSEGVKRRPRVCQLYIDS